MNDEETFSSKGKQAISPDNYDELLYRSLLKSLNNTLGPRNAEIALSLLREKGQLKITQLTLRR
jgi:hypothetical protein